MSSWVLRLSDVWGPGMIVVASNMAGTDERDRPRIPWL